MEFYMVVSASQYNELYHNFIAFLRRKQLSFIFVMLPCPNNFHHGLVAFVLEMPPLQISHLCRKSFLHCPGTIYIENGFFYDVF